MKAFVSPVDFSILKRFFKVKHVKICVTHMGKIITITADRIAFLRGSGNYTFIYMSNGERYLAPKTLKSFAQRLSQNFIRVHKSYLVNTDFVIERLEDDRLLKMTCGQQISVSRRKVKETSVLLNHKFIPRYA